MEKPAVIAPDRYILYPCFPPLLLFPMQEIHSPSSWQCHPPLNRTLKLYQNHRTRVKGSPLSRKIPQLPEVKLFGSSNQRIARRSNSRCLQCPANAGFCDLYASARESLYAIFRAGATQVISYWAPFYKEIFRP